MQNNLIFFLLIYFGCFRLAQSQESNIPKKYGIEKTGCSMYFFGKPSNWDITPLSNFDSLYVAQSEHNGSFYGAFVIKSNAVSEKDLTASGKEQRMLNFLDVFKETYEIKRCVGVGLGRTLEAYPAVIGAIDYCEDDKQHNFVIHTWNNGNIVAILFIIYGDEEPNINMQQLYFNGFKFP